MNVKELSDLLLTYPLDMRIMVDGYEGGLSDINDKHLEIEFVALDVNDESYYGEHEKVQTYNKTAIEGKECINALVIHRYET